MSQQTIAVGAAANDGTGDTLRDAFIKANANFTDLYTRRSLPYVSGNAYLQGLFVTGGGGAADTLYAAPFYLDREMTVAALQLYVIGASSGVSAKLGIYDTGSDGKPDALVAVAPSVFSLGTAATQVRVALAANVVLQPGIYWAASLFSWAVAAGSMQCFAQHSLSSLGLLGSSAGAVAAAGWPTGYSRSHLYSTGLPSNFGSGPAPVTSAFIPIPWLEAA
jgi:hypothetical protein